MCVRAYVCMCVCVCARVCVGGGVVCVGGWVGGVGCVCVCVCWGCVGGGVRERERKRESVFVCARRPGLFFSGYVAHYTYFKFILSPSTTKRRQAYEGNTCFRQDRTSEADKDTHFT